MNRDTIYPKRFGAGASVVLTLTALLVFWTLTGEGLARDATKAPVVSASEVDYPPFCIVDADGRAGGFSVELMRAALAATGREVTFRTGPWAEVKGWLEQGEVQALPLVGRTPEREAIFDFTFSYMSLCGAIVVRADTTDIRDLADLRGKSVAVMKGDNAEEFLRREDRGIEIHTTTSFDDALRQLSEGRHDAVVLQRLVAVRMIQEIGLKNLRVVNRPIEGYRQDFCFAVREGDRDTLALLNEGLALVMADGTYRHLHAKWFAALELPSNRRLVIGGDQNYPPFEYLDEKGRPAGYNVDLTRAIALAVGLDVEIRLGPWSEMERGLENGEIDALEGMFYSIERDLKFDFTPPHVVNHCVSVVRRDEDPPPTTLSELIGRRIVVERGDIMHEFAVENGLQAKVTAVDTQEDALRELATGKHDCALVARLTAFYWIEKEGLNNLTVGRRPLLSPGYCYAVPNGHKALLAQLGEGLKVLEETGQYRRIHEKWMGIDDEAALPVAKMLRYAAVIAGPLLLVLLGFFLWSWALRKQVARQTAELAGVSARHKAILAAVPDIIMEVDSNKIYTWANPAGLNFFGQDVIGKEAADYFIGEQETYDTVKPLFNGNENVVYIESWQRRKDGQHRLLAWWCHVLKDKSGQVSGALSTARDITERKQVEEALRESEERYRRIFENSVVGIFQSTPQGRFITVNSAFARMLGYAGAEELRAGISDIATQYYVHAEDRRRYRQILEKQGYVENFEFQVRHKDGSHPWVSNSARVYFGQDGAILYYEGIVIDITERKRAEQEREKMHLQLLQAQKMESIGRLAGGVAHDFNNMLGVILGYTEMALARINPADDLHADLTEIMTAARRSADITRQLLAFARKQTVTPKVLDLNETVEGSLKMLRRLIGEDIELQWSPATGLWPVEIDPAQVDQMLTNLCVNARDAIAGVGKLTIETENVRFDRAYCDDHPGFVPGEFALLAVSDDGCGIDKQALANIFEPFFTTKDVGEGTGLGLATVYGIVKQNGGFINAYSEPDKGTTFRIYLPRHAGEVETAGTQDTAEVPSGHGETILLVEDEVSILKLGKKLLEKLGYRVLDAETPDRAMELAGSYGSRIHLLITDVVMPAMNGRDLAARLHGDHCDLKVLYMSGYTADVIAQRGVLEAGMHFLQKPFSMRDLALKVKEALTPRSGK